MAEPELLNLPPAEAVRHFRAKGFHVGYDWRETDAAKHLVSFTVAKAMRLDILKDIRASVDQSIAGGMTFEEFQKELEPLLRKKGWWGGRLGSTRRLRIIFDTNIRMAYAKGRWEMIGRQAARAPWLLYDAVNDRRTRPHHLAWDGTILPWDHPWWKSHYPPNGWRCRCRVVQLSDADLKEFGLAPSSGPPKGSGRTRPWLNKITGETLDVPVGIDPGFGHNVGLLKPALEAGKMLGGKIASAPPALAAAAKKPELGDWIAGGRKAREEMVDAAGGVEAADFPGRFRRDLRRRLRGERGAGSVAAEIGAGPGGGATAKRVRGAAQELPASWVRAGNALPVNGVKGSKRGFYGPGGEHGPARVSVSKDAGNPLHEYCHHMQSAMPGLQAVFRDLHRRRTAGEKRVQVGAGTTEKGRKDDYIRPYKGREYNGVSGWGNEEPLEVLTMTMQTIFHPIWGQEYLRDLVRDDPELLDLALGVLFHYDP